MDRAQFDLANQSMGSDTIDVWLDNATNDAGVTLGPQHENRDQVVLCIRVTMVHGTA